MPEDSIRAAANTIFILCRGYGYDILRYPDNLTRYMKKKMPAGSAADIELCARVLAVPGAVDGLMWLRFYAGDAPRCLACREDLWQMVRKAAAADEEDAQGLKHAFEALCDIMLADADGSEAL